jgi:hypothetical protein
MNPLQARLLEEFRPMVAARRAWVANVAAGVWPTVEEAMQLARLETGSEDAAQEAGTRWMQLRQRREEGGGG